MRQSPEPPVPDVLSPAARAILAVNPAAYSRLTPAGDGSTEAKALLQKCSPDGLVTGAVRSAEDARAMLCGLWLYHDWLDESHAISQDLHSPTGSFWHVIMQ